MMKTALATAPLLFAAALTFAVPARAAVVYRSNEGWTIEGENGVTLEPTVADQMHKAEELEAKGNSGAALEAYQALVKKWPTSAVSPKAQRKVGLILEQKSQYDAAFKANELYLTKYPRGDDFDAVVESMYKTAKSFLDGEKKRVLGVPIKSNVPRAQAMFEVIVAKAPFSKWAPLSQFSVGQALEKQGKYPEAVAAYQQVVARYPSDAIADDAQYQAGYVRLRQYREGSYDRADALKAREAFEDFVNRYPNSEKVPQARENMKTLEGGQTKNQLQIAKYYDKQKQYKAAVIYYNDVIKQQPDSPDATFAKTRLEALKAQIGEDALRAGPEKVETGERAAARRKLQAKVDVSSRPDYVGPPVAMATPKVQNAPGRPSLRTNPGGITPVEPPLPGGKLDADVPGLPSPGEAPLTPAPAAPAPQ